MLVMDIVDSIFGLADCFPLHKMHSVASHWTGMDFVELDFGADESFGQLKTNFFLLKRIND